MGIVKQGKEAEEFIAAQQARMRQRLEAQKAQLSNEIRRCVRCGWQATKSECLAAGIKACPRCGGTECRGMSMDFDPKMLDLKEGPVK